jgi:cytochrome c-type biogenesis protein CcmH/NrfF
MDRDQVRAAFAAEAGGQHVLMAPIDKGFNRLAWLFPYLIGVSGVLLVGVVARRWSRRDDHDRAGIGADGTPHDATLTARLDDELRDLD